MDARITEKHDVAATVEVTVPTDVVAATFDRVFGALARQVRIPGFRPGKVPRGVLLQKIGEEALGQEVRDALVDEHYPRAVRELGLTPVHAHTHADLPAQDVPFVFTVHVELYPEFTLTDVDGIVIDTAGTPIGDDDVAATVQRLREDHATMVPVERSIEPGDVVFVETQGEGGGQSMPIDLDRTEAPLVEQLLGRSVGDALVLDLGVDPAGAVEAAGSAAADDAPPGADDGDVAEAKDDPAAPEAEASTAAAAAEADATIAEPPVRRSLSVRIADVKAKERPDPDDAFAATLGFGTWSDVDAEIRRGLAVERERETLRAQRDELVDKLMAGSEFALPESLVRRRRHHLVEDLMEDLKRRGLTMEAYIRRLEARGERERFEADLRSAAERSVKRDIVLERLLEVRGVAVSEAELDAAIRQVAVRERKDPIKFKRDADPAWLDNFRFLLARDKALDQLVREKTGRLGDADPLDDSAAEAAAIAAAIAAADATDRLDAPDHDDEAG